MSAVARPPKEYERQSDASGFERWQRCVIDARSLTVYDKLVLLKVGMNDWANIGDGCTKSVPNIASDLGIAERTVQRSLDKMRNLGVLTRRPRVGPSGRTSDSISINRAACIRVLGGGASVTPPPGVRKTPGWCQAVQEVVSETTPPGVRLTGEVLTVKSIQEVQTGMPCPADERKDHGSRSAAKKAASRKTWLTEYADLWREHFSADIPYGVAAKALKPLHDQHGCPNVLRALGNYLEANQGERANYVSLPKFASTFGQWLNPAPARTTQQSRNLAAIDRALGGDDDGES